MSALVFIFHLDFFRRSTANSPPEGWDTRGLPKEREIPRPLIKSAARAVRAPQWARNDKTESVAFSIMALQGYRRCGAALGSKPAGSPISFKYCCTCEGTQVKSSTC